MPDAKYNLTAMEDAVKEFCGITCCAALPQVLASQATPLLQSSNAGNGKHMRLQLSLEFRLVTTKVTVHITSAPSIGAACYHRVDPPCQPR
jgi:hypothetical protein